MNNPIPPDPEAAAAEAHRVLLESRCRKIGTLIGEGLAAEDEIHSTHTGFALFVFDFGENGTMAYISNAQRQDMLVAVRELLTKVEAGQL